MGGYGYGWVGAEAGGEGVEGVVGAVRLVVGEQDAAGAGLVAQAALGMTRGQVRGVIAWQTTLTLLIAVAVGGALGIVGGQLAWRAFAGSLGVVPVVQVPMLLLVLGLAALVLAGNLLASLPAAVAARTRPGVSLRTE